MQLQPTTDQLQMVETFRRFFDAECSIARTRAALPLGFDREMWRKLAGLGGVSIRVSEERGGVGLGLFDAILLMEEAGRALASGPLAESIAALRLLGQFGGQDELLASALAGESVVTLALHDVSSKPSQLAAGGAVAAAVIVRCGDEVALVRPTPPTPETTLASPPLARLALDTGERVVLGRGQEAIAKFEAAVEEWKLLIAAALAGLAREALRLASAYAAERRQFGKPIGAFQAISHPLAELSVDVDAGRLLVWSAVRDLADSHPMAGANVSGAMWWACDAAGRTVAQALHTFGGYGLTLEYDIHLYNLRAKAWPLVYGDPELLLQEAGRRRYGGETVHLPDAGELPIEFGLGADAEALAAETRAFFERMLTPELRARAHFSFKGHVPEVHRELARAGLLFPTWPRRLGGREANLYAEEAAMRVWHEFGWTTNFQGTVNMAGAAIDRFGAPELKRDVLAKFASGKAVCSLGFSEPGSGSDVFAAVTRATRDGDGWLINGQKMFTSGAERADYVLLLARTDPDAPKHSGLTMFIVPLKADGVTVQPVHTFQEEQTNITFYDNVRIPDTYRLGEVGGGVKVMAASLEMEHGMSFSGVHRQLLYAAERLCAEQGGGAIADARVQTRLAKAAARVRASELLFCRAMWAAEERLPNLAYGPASKLFSSEMFRADSADLLDLTAPDSLAAASRDAAIINLGYRHSQVTTVYGGTSEVHKSIIAERQLGLPRSR